MSNVSLGYAGRKVIDGLSARVPRAGITTLLGRNGSGKTTILRALIKYIRPMGGVVYLGGRDIAQIDARDMPYLISYVPAELQDELGISAYNVVTGARNRSGWVDEARARAALEGLGIGSLHESTFSELSTGQKRLVMMARAIAIDAPTVLLDEPTSGLDPANRLAIMRAIKGMARRNKSVIVATQDIEMAFESDWVIMIKDARLIGCGPSSRVMTSKLLGELYDSDVSIRRFGARRLAIFSGSAKRPSAAEEL